MPIVLANGCFDPLHSGHVLHLQIASRFGDVIVALTCDRSVTKEKGEGRPILPSSVRADVLRELRCVAGVVIVNDVYEALREVRPNIFCKGIDYSDSIDPAIRQYCDDAGIGILITESPKFSSTALINELRHG